MNLFIQIILATFIVSLISLVGILTISINHKKLSKFVFLLVALSAGTLLGGAFLHLIPESLESSENTFLFVLLGFILFLLIEKILHWRHCHDSDCKVHTFAHMSLLGDAVHNFIDGLIIATGFLVNIQTGIATTTAVALHEIPQEIGDFGVLLHGGFSKLKALLYNFISALTAVLGGIVGYLLPGLINNPNAFLAPIAAGGFIYIAASDLIPEIRKELHVGRSILNLLIFLLGIYIMYLLKLAL